MLHSVESDFPRLLLQNHPRCHCHRRSWFLRQILRPSVATALNTILWMFRFVRVTWGVTWPWSVLDLSLLFRWSGRSSTPQIKSRLYPQSRVPCPVIDNMPTALILCHLTSPYPPLLPQGLKSPVRCRIRPSALPSLSPCKSKVHKPVCSWPFVL